MKGELEMRLTVWIGLMADFRTHQQQLKNASLKKMHRITALRACARMLKSELGTRLMVWKELFADFKIRNSMHQQRLEDRVRQLHNVVSHFEARVDGMSTRTRRTDR